MEVKFYICKHCGNIIAYAKRSGVSVVCCGEEMGELVPNSTGASEEKHVPVYGVAGGTVTVSVGAAAHPMTEEHSIQWVCLQTDRGNQRKLLAPGAAPQVFFSIGEGETVEAVYAYCNLHGLWKA